MRWQIPLPGTCVLWTPIRCQRRLRRIVLRLERCHYPRLPVFSSSSPVLKAKTALRPAKVSIANRAEGIDDISPTSTRS